MADTAPKIAAKERREPVETVAKKAALLAAQIQKSKHFIVFTGAGISTSAGEWFPLFLVRIIGVVYR